MNDKLLEANGWTVECHSPLEIRHEDGSFATLNAARTVIESIEEEDRKKRKHIVSIEYADALDEKGYFVRGIDQFAKPIVVKRLFKKGDQVICKYADNLHLEIDLQVNNAYTVSDITINHGQPYILLEGFPRVRMAEWRFTLHIPANDSEISQEELDADARLLKCILTLEAKTKLSDGEMDTLNEMHHKYYVQNAHIRRYWKTY
jgi:hypothetical protein